MAIIGIVAIAKNYAIGKDGKLPWHYPADLKFFKETTTDHAVVMGFNTWKSIGKPLPNRLNLVISRSATIDHAPGVIVLREKQQLLELTKYLKGDLFLIGGAKTFSDFRAIIEKWIVTEVPVEIADADVFMPKDFLNGFSLEDSTELGDGLVVKSFRR